METSTHTPPQHSNVEDSDDAVLNQLLEKPLDPKASHVAAAETVAATPSAVDPTAPLKKKRGRQPGYSPKKKGQDGSVTVTPKAAPVGGTDVGDPATAEVPKKRRGRAPGTVLSKKSKKVGSKRMGRPKGSKNKSAGVKGKRGRKAVVKAGPVLKTKGLARSLTAGVKQIQSGIAKILKVQTKLSKGK